MQRRNGHRSSFGLLALAWLALAAGAAGCGGAPSGRDDSGDPLAYAEDVKHLVTQGLELAKRGPRELAVDRVHILRDAIAQYPQEPTKGHEATYQALLADLDELIALYRNAAPPGQITAKLDETLARAQTLPGEMRPWDPE